MNAFVNAVKNDQLIGKTFNGAVTNRTSESRVLDFFSAAGNRAVDLKNEFDLALAENKSHAYRVALWTRDIRGGAGERETFRNLLKHIEKHYEDDAIKLLPMIPILGRWDDLLVFTSPKIKAKAFRMIKDALNDGNGLTAKWMPRKGVKAEELRKFLEYTPKRYRKTLSNLSKTVEQQMCAREWDKIVFDHVPSVASSRYQKAFSRHCGDAYKAYKEGLKKVDPETGKTERKVNVGAVYPYDIIKSLNNGDREVSLAQWEALPNYLGDNKILPVVDVSASMTSWGYYGQKPIDPKIKVTPMDIALSVGLYCADKQTGDFSGMFMTFSDDPKIQKLSGDLVSKITQMQRSHWSMSTNVEAAFEEILKVAIKNKVSAEDMPKVLLILSDMEFNSCIKNPNQTMFNNAKEMYERYGYVLPTVVFWQINGRSDNNPVKMHDSNTAIVSGFSTSIFKSILKSDMERYSPYNVMLDVILSNRYDIEGLTV